jgi:hypothetical protein
VKTIVEERREARLLWQDRSFPVGDKAEELERQKK